MTRSVHLIERDLPVYASRAAAASVDVPAAIKSLRTNYYAPNYAAPATLKGGANYTRTSKAVIDAFTGMPSSAYFRTVDRYLPDGTTDATNGGYWLINENELDVTQFGAVVDDATDDEAACNDAFAAAAAFGGRVVTLPSGSCYITDTVTCGPLSSVKASSGAQLHYVGSGDALVITGANTTERPSRTHLLPHLRRATTVDWNLGTDTSSVGVRIVDCKYDNFHMQSIRRFDRGLVLQAAQQNTVCCKFYLGAIQNNRIGIDMSEVATGWGINQCVFIGGACIVDSAYTTTPNRIHINMPSTENNTHVFVGVNLEAGGNEKGIVCASGSNLWDNCRLEGCAAKAGYVTVSGNNNRFIGGAPSSSDTPPYVTWVSDTGSGNMFLAANGLFGEYLAIDFHSASNPLRFGNGSAYPYIPIGAYGTYGLQLGDSNTLAVRHYGFMQQEGAAVTTGTTLPWRNSFTLTYGSATTVTGMSPPIGLTDTSGFVAMMATNGNATIQHTGSPAANAGKFVLKAGADLTLTANTPVLFMMSGGNLYQI